MAHFYAEIQGARGEASRCGSKSSGMDGHVRGWTIGARVRMRHNDKTGKDECTIFLTSGSNGNHSNKCLGTFTEDDFSRPIELPAVRPLVKLKEAEGGA